MPTAAQQDQWRLLDVRRTTHGSRSSPTAVARCPNWPRSSGSRCAAVSSPTSRRGSHAERPTCDVS